MNTSELEVFPEDHYRPKPPAWKIGRFWARAILILLVFSIVVDICRYLQVLYLLSSPVIPKETVAMIAKPFLLAALFLTVVALIGALLLVYKRNRSVVVLGLISLLVQAVYLSIETAHS